VTQWSVAPSGQKTKQSELQQRCGAEPWRHRYVSTASRNVIRSATRNHCDVVVECHIVQLVTFSCKWAAIIQYGYIVIGISDTTYHFLTFRPVRSQYAATRPTHRLPTVPSVRTRMAAENVFIYTSASKIARNLIFTPEL